MEVVTLVGYGAHGRDIEAIWKRTNPYGELALYEHHKEVNDQLMGFIVGVNDPTLRATIHADLQRQGGWAARPLVDPAAVCNTNRLGLGVVIAPHATVLDSVLYNHVHVNYGSHMTRASIGEYSTVSPGVTICGDVTIGDRVFIGAGATICNLVTIGDDAIIGAGAVVLKDVPPNVTVMGVPAKTWTGGQ